MACGFLKVVCGHLEIPVVAWRCLWSPGDVCGHLDMVCGHMEVVYSNMEVVYGHMEDL
jgi:hypothetical protein